MKVLIHACPKRMWYVEGFLLPELKRQGADEVEVWNDTEGKGNLRACMEAFAARGTGDPSSAPSGHLPPGEGKGARRFADPFIVYLLPVPRLPSPPQRFGFPWGKLAPAVPRKAGD